MKNNINNNNNKNETSMSILSILLRTLKCQILVIGLTSLILLVYYWNIPVLLSSSSGIRSSSNSSSNSSSSKEDKKRIEKFQAWLRRHGADIHPNVTIANFAGYGYGILAAYGDVKYYDALFEIPSSLILSTQSILGMYSYLLNNDNDYNNDINVYSRLMDVPHMIRQVVTNTSSGDTNDSNSMMMIIEDVIISLQLMVECSLHIHGRSKFGPYLDILPDNVVPRLDTFSEEELSYLQDEILKSLAIKSRNSLRRVWYSDLEKLVIAMLRHQDGIPGSKNLNDNEMQCLSFETFHKYVTIVGSRAMVLNGKKYLTPMPDFTNYSPRPLEYDDRNVDYSFNLYHYMNDEGRGSMVVRADRDSSQTLQVFEDYGKNDNSLYMEMFGFVPQENPFNCAMLDLNRYYPERTITLLTKLNLVQQDKGTGQINSWPSACVLENGELAFKTAENFFAIIGIAENLTQQQRCEDAIKSKDYEFINISCFRYSGYKQKARAAIIDTASYTLQLKTTTLSSDLQHLHQTPKLSENIITALLFRIREKGILTEVSRVTIDEVYADTSAIAPSSCKVDDSQLEENISDTRIISIVNEFNNFVDNKLNLSVKHIKAVFLENGMRVGAIATKSLDEGDVYLSSNDGSEISAATALSDDSNTPYVQHLFRTMQSAQDDFHILLFHLMNQNFILRENSAWWPYLQLLPSIDEMKSSSPLWFDDETLDFLSGSDVRSEIVLYQRQTLNKYNYMMGLPVVIRTFGSSFSLDNYLWAHSIIDSRSIWYDGSRHLVPLLDLINCSSRPTIIHRTDKTSSGTIETKAPMQFQKGEQVVENYGQPNYIYMMYHGFILSENQQDCVLFKSLAIDPNMSDIVLSELRKDGFHSYNPTFCIKDDESLTNMERFLQIKYRKENVRDELKEVLQQRLVRIDASFELVQSCGSSLSITRQQMLEHVRNEQTIIANILREF